MSCFQELPQPTARTTQRNLKKSMFSSCIHIHIQVKGTKLQTPKKLLFAYFAEGFSPSKQLQTPKRKLSRPSNMWKAFILQLEICSTTSNHALYSSLRNKKKNE